MPIGLRKLSLQKKKSLTEQSSLTGSHRNSSNNLLTDALICPQTLQIGHHSDGPVANVSRLLSETAKADRRPPLFCEMLSLDSEEENGVCWRQTTRWIKYEQTVEGGGSRFSKPHLSFLSVPSILQLRSALKRGIVLLDEDAESFGALTDLAVRSWVERGFLNEERIDFVKMLLSAPKLHSVQGRLRRPDELRESSRHLGRRSPNEMTETADADEHLLKKLAVGTESAVILTANVPTLERPLTAFIRLKESKMLYPEVPDHAVPIRFLFVLLNRTDSLPNESVSIGRTMGSLFSDEVFHDVVYRTNDKFLLSDAAEEFISQSIIIPPGKCSVESRCSPEDFADEDSDRSSRWTKLSRMPQIEEENGFGNEEIVVSGKLFGGLRSDIRRKKRFYFSDFGDFFGGRLSQSIAATLSVFFANLTNIITFGAVMERMLDGQMAAIENIVCGALSGILFGLLSGQPLNILSATGPTLIFEKIIFDICRSNGWDFLPFRFWMGVWIALILLVIVAKDLSAMVGFITRFTEEAFAALISVVFIIQAVEKVLEIRLEAPLSGNISGILSDPNCFCSIGNNRSALAVGTPKFEEEIAECRKASGSLSGSLCSFRPDTFLFSVILAIGTYGLAMRLHSFKNAQFFSSRVRNFVSDFGVLISITVFTGIGVAVGIGTPTLQVPDSFEPTLPRSWIVDIFVFSDPLVPFLAAVPALLYAILIVMDQQITAVIVNRKDNLLKKGGGYHLDLAVVALLVVICGLLGLPFYVAATVLSVAHLDSLRIQSDVNAPADCFREQRLSTIIAHLLIGCSLFLTPLLRYVPLPVLIGIFLYMGVVSLNGMQFVERLKLLFTPIKYQPDLRWMRSVRLQRAHLFTLIQIVCIVSLFVLKSIGPFKIAFPLMLLVMVITRSFLLERIFEQSELIALDDRLPRWGDLMRSPKSPDFFGSQLIEDGKITNGTN